MFNSDHVQPHRRVGVWVSYPLECMVDSPKNLRENWWQPKNTFKKSPKMIPKQNHIENSFKLIKDHADINLHAKFDSDLGLGQKLPMSDLRGREGSRV